MAGAMYRLPFEDDGGWRVSKTNWDDPKAAHDSNQAYAFDFPHDIGGKIRAARGGLVVSRESRVTFNNNDLPDDHPQKNEHRGGNWVLVRHSDDTVAIYYHLNTDEVLVKKGDVVAQGEPIARSGNTGHSTGPHLHFEVKSFWNSDDDCGPSIPVAFEDKNHASFRPFRDTQVASNNAYLRDENWRRCLKCQSLFLAGRRSICPKGGKHTADEKTNFVLQRIIGKGYFFKGDRYSRYDVAADGVEPGFPAKISRFWPKLWEDDIDAAVTWNNGKAYFFKGDQYIRWDIKEDKIDEGFPATISKFWPGLWEGSIDAAVMWNNGKAYFFKGDQYIRWDVKSDTVDKGFPATISKFWPGLWEGSIDAAVMWNNGKAYFFKGDQYIRWDVKSDTVDKGFPATISKFWSGLEGSIDAAVLWPDTGQHEWQLCQKCAGLFSRTRGKKQCPAGNEHENANNIEYSLPPASSTDSSDTSWHLCRRCAGVFFGKEDESACPAGQKHEAAGDALLPDSIVTEVAEEGWKFCEQCGCLFYELAPESVCAAGGKHAPHGGGYVVMMNCSGAPGQHNWLRCTKCAVMFFGESQHSVCPKGHAHVQVSHADYSLVVNQVNAPGQHQWGQCAKCAALFHIGSSKCPAGGGHSAVGTPNTSVMRRLAE
jgi:murein DD-endopeptidase MepM/ murein hydrolase activator NlpD